MNIVVELTGSNVFGTGSVDDLETAESYDEMFQDEDIRVDLARINDLIKPLNLGKAGDEDAEDFPTIVVEVGAGTGVYTEAISKALPRDNGVLIQLDIVPCFAAYLQKNAEKYDNVVVGQNTPDSLCLSPTLKVLFTIFRALALYWIEL